MKEVKAEIGIIGLGVMGRNLLLNIADHGYHVAGYDKDKTKLQTLQGAIYNLPVYIAGSLKEFISFLREPRAVLILVPAGPPVDSVIAELIPLLKKGDTIIDGGNSYFKDTERRSKELSEFSFMGVGISGGEFGARHGPCIMPGGPEESYERVRPMFEAIAARASGKPCVAYLGPGASGHYVKMVHNGIEYGVMQLISEAYHLMKQGLSMSNESLHSVFDSWNQTEMNGFLIEITAEIFTQKDDRTGNYLVDVILDEARQKGTGLWTSREAMILGVPLPTVDLAVVMRELSDLKPFRLKASKMHNTQVRQFDGNREEFIDSTRHALYSALLITYSQGMSLLQVASRAYGFNLKLEDISLIWQGGCIIRAALLEKIKKAYEKEPSLRNLLLDPDILKEIQNREEHLRSVVKKGVELSIPVPGLSVSLSYLDGYLSSWLPANLIQAQRDYFGAHSYERVDASGVFHTEWRPD